jgi:O-antigen biosynthesis protein
MMLHGGSCTFRLIMRASAPLPAGEAGPADEGSAGAVWQRLARPAVFQVPALLREESAWIGHVPFAFWLVDVLRPRRFVELGTHVGVSYCAFCQAVGFVGSETTCAAVDSWEGDPQSRSYDDGVYEELRRHHDPRYGAFSELVRARFDDAVERFADGSIDLLHIDGFHEESAVRHDIESWRPKLGERAVVLLHDVEERREGYGVWRVWDDLAPRYPHFAFRHGHGLGLLAVGPAVAEPIRWLTGLTNSEAEVVRGFFEARAESVSARLELIRVGAELGRQLRRVEELDQEARRAAQLEAEIAKVAALEAALAEATRRGEEDRHTVARIVTELEGLREERAALASELERERRRSPLVRRLERLLRPF